ncbi:aminotransferase class V-fold PLP-dependent enzyme [Phenylobacterium sp. Root700]|uniref:aminotransferase class V-fold PLP-dependent enzyme n=1 Tax=Phenylobacterium sp. Root700 TaxID=1736591 RepID=UPI0006F871AB|nr:aminotransferase class V-fold PLP-dependent enzyme [Phenylobacterium sp. Root700]KRB49626.1 hypothetical protein ASE02_17620 [Phenylobacterium sp. Root700]
MGSTARLSENRRRALQLLAGSVCLAQGASAAKAKAAVPDGIVLARQAGGDVVRDETHWASVRRLFPLKPGLVHLNSANLAPSSLAVLDTEVSLSRDVCGDPSFENRLKFEATTEATRRALATMLGADPDEIAITRNTSEGNRTVIAGLDLGPGDEVLIWDQNHESNSAAWDVWAARLGFKVVRVATPAAPRDRADLAAAFTSAFSDRTKVLAFSQVSNISGVALPADALCRAAAARGILTLVDGAQTFGVLDLDLHAMGCDFYTASAHKWLGGPHETGVLYVRSLRAAALWPSMVTHNWDAQSKAGARKFDCLGQRQEGRIAALHTAIALQDQIGRPRIEQRIRHLVAELRAGLMQTDLRLEFVTPRSPDMHAGILMFLIEAKNSSRVMATFYERFRVSALATPAGDRTLVRFSPNIYNSRADVLTALAAVANAVMKG